MTADTTAALVAAPDSLAFQLLAAACYIDALGGDSRSYRAALAAAEAQPAPEDIEVPNTFKLPGESDDAWLDRITGAQPAPAQAGDAVPVTAEQHFKFSAYELADMAKNPRVLAALMDYHEARQTEADAFFGSDEEVGCTGNRLRKQALYERGRSIMAEDLDIWDNDLRAAFGFPLYAPQPVAQAQPAAVPTVTDAMVAAYLQANDAYWRKVDEPPATIYKWRNGTPKEATRVSLQAALAAAQPAAAVPAPAVPDWQPMGAASRLWLHGWSMKSSGGMWTTTSTARFRCAVLRPRTGCPLPAAPADPHQPTGEQA